MRDLAELLTCSLNNSIVGVTDRGHADTAAHIDELVSVDVNDDRVVRTIHIDGKNGVYPRRHNLLAALVNLA